MRWRLGIGACALVLASLAAGDPIAAQERGLRPFGSDSELRAFLRKAIAAEYRASGGDPMMLPPPPPPSPPLPAPPAPSTASQAAPAAPAAPNITNTQVANVDEGDIVKLRGDVLVILRRGRLFTVSLAGGTMRAVAAIDAFPPGVDARGDWYDEMLVSGDRVVVVGYSYRRGGTQVNRFRLDDAGRLTFEDAYQLRSSDYYSSRNYATRLIGNRLILYSPLNLRHRGDPLDALPGMRRWQPGEEAREGGFRRIVGSRSVYVPRALLDPGIARITNLHSVSACDLTAPVLDCTATVVMGSETRTFFVSGNAVYLWTSDVWQDTRRNAANSFLYRMPFDGSVPAAVATRGGPVDQFSFLADSQRSALQIVVRADSNGDGMWRPEATSGDVALLTVPTALFGSGRDVPLDRYRPLPRPKGDRGSFQNRFVGDTLLYGAGAFGDTQPGMIYAVPLAGGAVTEVPLAHAVDRIEAIGPDAMVVGQGQGYLGFSAVALAPGAPRLDEAFRLPDAAEGESRSHAFFFRPDRDDARGGSGLLGLPVARAKTAPGARFLGNSAAMLFLERRSGRLTPAGELAAAGTEGSPTSDNCQASCVDWYGNARPIFIGDRIFALLGYELVEGRELRGAIREAARVSFAP